MPIRPVPQLPTLSSQDACLRACFCALIRLGALPRQKTLKAKNVAFIPISSRRTSHVKCNLLYVNDQTMFRNRNAC